MDRIKIQKDQGFAGSQNGNSKAARARTGDEQDSVPTHAARQIQKWLELNIPDFITKNSTATYSPDLNLRDYHVWGAIFKRYRFHKPNPRNKMELNVVMEGAN